MEVAVEAVEHFRHGDQEQYYDLLQEVKLQLDTDDELMNVMKEAGMPDALMERAIQYASRGERAEAEKTFDKLKRCFGEECAWRLDAQHSFSVAMAV